MKLQQGWWLIALVSIVVGFICSVDEKAALSFLTNTDKRKPNRRVVITFKSGKERHKITEHPHSATQTQTFA